MKDSQIGHEQNEDPAYDDTNVAEDYSKHPLVALYAIVAKPNKLAE